MHLFSPLLTGLLLRSKEDLSAQVAQIVTGFRCTGCLVKEPFYLIANEYLMNKRFCILLKITCVDRSPESSLTLGVLVV